MKTVVLVLLLTACIVISEQTSSAGQCGGVNFGGFVCQGCRDIDECQINNGGCDAHATCTNTVGGFTCSCNAGFSGDGQTCTDVNECETNNGGCNAHATCTNTVGGFTCSCNAGFSGDGQTCTDINECLTNNGGCAALATCTNTPGGFTCTCYPGLTGDGTTCTSTTRNVALYQPAMQSTTYESRTASLAVDYSRSTAACSLSQQTFANWWAVDLGTPKTVSVILVTNENNAAGANRLDNFKAGVTNTAPTVGAEFTSYTLCEQYSGSVASNGTVAVQCPRSGLTYRYVIIQSGRTDNDALCLADVQVYDVVPTDGALGCYRDSANRDLNGAIWQGKATKERCIAYCYSLGFRYAGLQAKEWCLCGNEYGRQGTATCNMQCTADTTQICGDSWANSVYTTGN